MIKATRPLLRRVFTQCEYCKVREPGVKLYVGPGPEKKEIRSCSLCTRKLPAEFKPAHLTNQEK